MLSLELSLAPPAPPSPSQAAPAAENGELCLDLRLWPPAAAQEAAAEKPANACSCALPAGGEEDEAPREWEEKVRAMTAAPPERVLEKKLYATDVSAVHSRLLLAENMDRAEGGKRKGPKLLLSLLTDEEKAAAGNGGGGWLPVTLLDRRGREYAGAKLKLWQSSDSYVIIGKWTELVRKNELDPGDVIDVYFFRQGGGVGLVVCSRLSAAEEERRRRDDGLARKRRRDEKGEQMRAHKRRRGSCH